MHQANRAVRNFLTVPRQLEKLLLFGMLVCVDTFLYVTTFLPIRIVISIASALFHLVTRYVRTRACQIFLIETLVDAKYSQKALLVNRGERKSK